MLGLWFASAEVRRLGGFACTVTLLSGLAACVSSPTGRDQLILMSDAQMGDMGQSAFHDMKQRTPVVQGVAANGYVSCIVEALLVPLPGEHSSAWEVVVFDDPAINAFALPGRKIGVYRGLLELADNQHQLATVIGHEIAHVRARHANERVSTSFVTQSGLQIVQIAAGADTRAQRDLFSLLGLGTQVGVLLPFNRAQEAEADVVGLQLMSRAGFDPRESVRLWQAMSTRGGARPPEFLSTHPSSSRRIHELNARMNEFMDLSVQARISGLLPDCTSP